MTMFKQMLSGDPSTAAIAISRAAENVLYHKTSISRACKHYNVLEQSIIQFIVDKTIYETTINIERAKLDINPDNYGNK